MPYVDATYYKNSYYGTVVPDDELDTYLGRASNHIDILTFYRIENIDDLTAFQQKAVKNAVCAQADQDYSNKDFSPSVQSYSVEGVSVSYNPNIDRQSSKLAVSFLLASGLMGRCL